MSSALVLIDWENISKDIIEGRYVPERFSREVALVRLFEWIKGEAEEIFDTFLFSPLFIVYTDFKLFHDHGLVSTTCPKVPLGSPEKKDTVDTILIEKGLKWITHPELTHLCLASGDSDFIPLVKEAKKIGLKIMLSALDPAVARVPGRQFLSKELAKMADISPKTGQPMIHYFCPII
jgi:hypothetical protein